VTPKASTRAGELAGLTGVDAPYEPPTQADLVLRSGEESVEAAVVRVTQVLAAHVPYLAPAAR
jgi:adenylylsulfate kinase-like enzyme